MQVFFTILVCGICVGFCGYSLYRLICALRERKKKRLPQEEDRKEKE